MTECSEHESDATSANRRSNTFDSVCEEEAPIWLTTRVSLDGGVNPDAWTCCCLTDWRVFLVARVWHLLSALRIQFHFLVRCCVFGGGGGGAIFDVRLIGGGGSCDFVLQFSCFFCVFRRNDVLCPSFLLVVSTRILLLQMKTDHEWYCQCPFFSFFWFFFEIYGERQWDLRKYLWNFKTETAFKFSESENSDGPFCAMRDDAWCFSSCFAAVVGWWWSSYYCWVDCPFIFFWETNEKTSGLPRETCIIFLK